MTTIDFDPGMHGHFLTYVVNQYIFNIGVPTDNLFHRSGAAHNINVLIDFLDKSMTTHGHYSYYGLEHPVGTDRIIWICPDPQLDFVLLTNIFHRCAGETNKQSDVDPVTIHEAHLDLMQASSKSLQQLRENWYTKLKEQHLKKSVINNRASLPVYQFDYRSFFDIESFVCELSSCADFLDHRLHFCSDLVDLHNNFLRLNQGYQKWKLAQSIVQHILNNEQMHIDTCDWQLQSYINYVLNKIFKIHSGRLFEDDSYPASTQEIFTILQQFLDSYDKNH